MVTNNSLYSILRKLPFKKLITLNGSTRCVGLHQISLFHHLPIQIYSNGQHITSTNNNKKLSALQGAQRVLFWFSYPCSVSMFVQQGALLCHCWIALSVVIEPTLQLHKQKL